MADTPGPPACAADTSNTRILVLGAGVIGTLYAVSLAKVPGVTVTLAARGERLEQIAPAVSVKRGNSIEIVPLTVVAAPVHVAASWDYILVCVRYDQVDTALRDAATLECPTIVTLVNGPGDYTAWERIVGVGRLVPAFPGAGGSIDADGVLDASATPALIQRTTLGEVSGKRSARVTRLAALLRRAGFPTAVSARMGAWQLTHLALVVSLTDAVYASEEAGWSQPSEDTAALGQAVDDFRKYVARLGASGVQPAPLKIALLARLPRGVLRLAVTAAFRSDFGDKFINRHARRARGEMGLAKQALLTRLH